MSGAILFLPELVALIGALFVFACIVFERSPETTWRIALLAGAASVAAAFQTLDRSGQPFFEGIYRVDFFSQALKLVFAAGYLLVVALGARPGTLRPSVWRELPLFLLLSTVGMMAMVSATELLTLFLALELSAFPLYALAVLHRDGRIASEGAAKYMLQGMVASAVSLYGVSFLFGMTGTTYLAGIGEASHRLATEPLFWVGLGLTLAGFLFKLALFPFHFWAPDTYQSAPHPVVAFIASASKVATAGVLCRIVSLMMHDPAESLRTALVLLAVVGMTVGNLAALAQSDFKRLLGYSAVAHAGYMIVGLQAMSDLGLSSVVFYAVGYAAMSFLCLLVVSEVGNDRADVSIDSLAGLSRRSPFLAMCLLVGLFGLTGLPPTVGFIGKWFLFSAALERGQFLLVLIAASNAVIATFYYLKVLRSAYLAEPTEGALSPSVVVRVAACAAVFLVVWTGTMPNTLWDIARGAAGALLLP